MTMPVFPEPIKRRICMPLGRPRRYLRTGSTNWGLVWWIDSVKPYDQPAVVTRPLLKDSGDALICEHLGAQKMLVTDREGRTRFRPIVRRVGVRASDRYLLPIGESSKALDHPKSHLFSHGRYRVLN